MKYPERKSAKHYKAYLDKLNAPMILFETLESEIKELRKVLRRVLKLLDYQKKKMSRNPQKKR